MFEKNMKFAYLLDLYGNLLDEHTKSVLKSYYEEDLSLGEIAEETGISRQGVRHTVKHGEEQLAFFEERLALSEKDETEKAVLALLEEARTSLLVGADALSAIEEAILKIKNRSV